MESAKFAMEVSSELKPVDDLVVLVSRTQLNLGASRN